MNLSNNSSKYTNDDHPGSLASQEYLAAVSQSRVIGKKTKQHPRIPLSPMRSETTSATWTHSSCSSRSLYSDQHHCPPSPTPGNRRRSRPDAATLVCNSSRYTRADSVVADDFGSLSRLSRRYRDGCLLMDEGQCQNDDNQYISNSLHRINSSTLERFLISLETLREVPVFPASATTNNKIALLPKRNWRHEPISDADRKPAAKKKSPTQQSPPPPLAPYLSMAPPRRQLKGDPLYTEQEICRRHSHANAAPSCASTRPSSSEDQTVWSSTMTQPTAEQVQRQQAILDAIEHERRLAQVQGVTPVVPLSSGSSSRKPATAASAAARRPPQDPNTAVSLTTAPRGTANAPRRTSYANRTASTAAGTTQKNPSSATMSMVDDRVADLGNGKKIRLKGTKHAYKSILQGQATIVQCPCCRIMLQISATAKNLYCTSCQQVSPIGLENDGHAGAAGGPNCHSSNLDQRIAHALQRQEIHVSQTVKHAKA